mgnify:CR=1 FL=1
MRLDKFLKTARIFKRRPVAKEVALHKKVTVNGRMAKPGTDIGKGDILTISYKDKELSLRILDTSEHVSKEDASGMYEIISEK